MLPLMYVLLYNIWNIITGYAAIMKMASRLGHPYLESINMRYPTDQKGKKFLAKFLLNFKKNVLKYQLLMNVILKE